MDKNFVTTICDCQRCVSMCCNFPCMGSLAEIEKLIELGHGSKLMLYQFWDSSLCSYVSILLPANENHIRQSIFGTYFKSGRCVFLSKENKCLLHEANLKPLEGRFADCNQGISRNLSEQQYKQEYREMKSELNAEWLTERAKALISLWKEKFYKKAPTFYSNDAVEIADSLF